MEQLRADYAEEYDSWEIRAAIFVRDDDAAIF
jgi:hypothetical protein